MKPLSEMTDDELNGLAGERGLFDDSSSPVEDFNTPDYSAPMELASNPKSLSDMSDDELDGLAKSRGLSGATVVDPPKALPTVQLSKSRGLVNPPDPLAAMGNRFVFTLPPGVGAPPVGHPMAGMVQTAAQAKQNSVNSGLLARRHTFYPTPAGPELPADRAMLHLRNSHFAKLNKPEYENVSQPYDVSKLAKDPLKYHMGQVTRSMADDFGLVLKTLQNGGVPVEQLMRGVRTASAQQNALPEVDRRGAKVDAGIASLLGLGDAVANFGLHPVNRVLPDGQKLVSNMEGAYESKPSVQAIKGKAPGFYDQYKTMAGILGPFPNVSAAKGLAPIAKGAERLVAAAEKGSVGAKAADSAATMGLINMLLQGDQQVKHGGSFDDPQVGLAAGLGLIGGGAIGAGAGALEKLAMKGKARIAPEELPPTDMPTPPSEPVPSGVTDMAALDDEIAALLGKPVTKAPVSKSETFQSNAGKSVVPIGEGLGFDHIKDYNQGVWTGNQMVSTAGPKDPNAVNQGIWTGSQPNNEGVWTGSRPTPPSEPVPKPVPEQGDWRFQQDGFGRQRVDGYDDISSHPMFKDNPEAQAVVRNLAEMKAQADYDKAVRDQFLERLYGHYGGGVEGRLVHPDNSKVYVTRKDQPILSTNEERQLQQLRYELAGGTRQAGKPNLAMTAEQSFVPDPRTDFHLKAEVPELTGNLVDDLKTAVILHRRYEGKTDGLGSQTAYEEAKKYDAGAGSVQQVFFDMEKQLRERTGDPQAKFTGTVSVPAPGAGNEGKGLRIRFETKQGQQNLTLDKQAQETFDMMKGQVERSNPNRKYKPEYSVAAGRQKLKNIFPAVGLGLIASTDQGASAADNTTDPTETQEKQVERIGWAGVRLVAAGVLFHKFAPAAARKFLSKENIKIAQVGMDTLDAIQMYDKEMKQNLAQTILTHTAAVQRKSWGVKFGSQQELETGRELLRTGTVTPQEVLQGKPGTVFENWNKAQREALYTYDAVANGLHQEIGRHLADVNAKISLTQKQGQKSDFLNVVRENMEKMQESLKPTKRPDGLERAYSKVLSHFFDYQFFWNPEFHGTNLTDQFIAGGSRVGASTMVKANYLLAADKELADIFRTSNLVGGYEIDKVAANVQAGRTTAGPIKDLPSDKINADRVSLGSLLQFAETSGYKGKEAQFVKDLFGGRVDAETSMRAYNHMAETLSRTLGVDPLRLNTDFFSRSNYGRVLGTFVKQPARLSRLALNYVANGQMGKFYTMLGVTALVAGKAAIPTDVGYVWESIDPDSAFLAASLAEKVDMYQRFTGQDLSPKLKWGVLYPLMASREVVGTNIAQSFDSVMQELDKLQSGEGTPAKQAAALGRVLSMVLPRVKGVPVRPAVQGVKYGEEAVSGVEPVSYYDNYGHRYGQTEDRALGDDPLSRVGHFLSQYAPGTSGPASRMQEQKYEAKVREKPVIPVRPVRSLLGLDSAVGEDQQYFNPKFQSAVDDGMDLLKMLGSRGQ